jgi:hypothetical protein
MSDSSHNRDSQIILKWYEHAKDLAGSVESYLTVIRDINGQTIDEQRNDLGISESDFARLRAMRLPREKKFSSDTLRIANACNVNNPDNFLDNMLLARDLMHKSDLDTPKRHYRAAFDETDNMNE